MDNKIQNAIHEELLFQIKGLINIELGNYLWELEDSNGIYPYGDDSIDLYMDTGGDGIDIYAITKDVKLTTINADWYMVGHYHADDLLYLILNWKEEKESMKEEIYRIFNFHKYMLDKKKEKISEVNEDEP